MTIPVIAAAAATQTMPPLQLLSFGLSQPKGELSVLTAFLFVGWMLFFVYYVAVYPALQDVIESQLRATAMAVYFFFQYVLGAAFGFVSASLEAELAANFVTDIASLTKYRAAPQSAKPVSKMAMGITTLIDAFNPVARNASVIAPAFAACMACRAE